MSNPIIEAIFNDPRSKEGLSITLGQFTIISMLLDKFVQSVELTELDKEMIRIVLDIFSDIEGIGD